VPAWTAGGVTALNALPPPHAPQPGDIVNKVDRNHFGIITWVGPLPTTRTADALKGVALKTVEGNTDGGQILEHSSTIKDWDQGGWGVRTLEPEKKAAPSTGAARLDGDPLIHWC
jgi:hypothetical protein